MTVPHEPTRRSFLAFAATSASALAAGSPFGVRASDKSGKRTPVVVGEGEHRYECQHGWGEVPDHVRWFETHGVAVDRAGLIYVKHRAGDRVVPESSAQDTIVVFDPAGKFVRSFGKGYHGGGHGIDVREEDGEEFLYLSCMMPVNLVVKTDLKGKEVWRKERKDFALCHKYDDAQARFAPTNIAFAPDGGFFVADGYGSNYVHKFDKDARYLSTFGGTGKGVGQFQTPHGLWLDDRPGRAPSLVVADRANARLQYFDLEGKPLRIVEGVSFPAHFDIRGEVLLVPDLHARVTLMDRADTVITHLGYDPAWTRRVLDGFKMRTQPDTWVDGRFIHPHDACFDRDGNVFVTEWVSTGRVSKLRKV